MSVLLIFSLSLEVFQITVFFSVRTSIKMSSLKALSVKDSDQRVGWGYILIKIFSYVYRCRCSRFSGGAISPPPSPCVKNPAYVPDNINIGASVTVIIDNGYPEELTG